MARRNATLGAAVLLAGVVAGLVAWFLLRDVREGDGGLGLARGFGAAVEEVEVRLPDSSPGREGAHGVRPSEARLASRQGAGSEAGAPVPLADSACTLRGTVFGPDGDPAPTDGAVVHLVDSLGVSRYSRVDRGQYAIAGLEAGRCWVTARAGEREVEQVVLLAAGQREHWLDLTLPPARVIDVFVLAPDGSEFSAAARRLFRRPAAALVAVATRDAPPSVLTDADAAMASVPAPYGRVLPGQPWGRLMLDDRSTVFVSLVLGRAVLVTEPVSSDREAVTLTFDPRDLGEVTSGLRFRLVDADTGAAVHAGVCLLASSTTLDLVAVEPDGSAEVASCSPGPARLELRLDGFEAREIELELLVGQVLDLGTLELEPGFVVSGTARVRSVASRVVMSVRTPGDPARHSLGYALDDDQSFRIDLGPGVYVLSAVDRSADPPHLSPNYLVDLRSGSVEGLIVELAPPVPVVVRPEDESWDGALATLVDAAGLESARVVLDGSRPWRASVAPGEHVLRLTADGRIRHEVPFRAADDVTALSVPPRADHD